MKSPFNKLFDFFHLAIRKIFRFAAIPADQMMMVFTIVIRKLIAASLRYVVNFRQHPQPTEQLNSAINRGEIDVAIRQLRVHSGWSQRPLVLEKHLQHQAPRRRLAKTPLDHSPLNDIGGLFHLSQLPRANRKFNLFCGAPNGNLFCQGMGNINENSAAQGHYR